MSSCGVMILSVLYVFTSQCINFRTSSLLFFSHFVSHRFASVFILFFIVGRLASSRIFWFGKLGRFMVILTYCTCDISHWCITLSFIIISAALPYSYSDLMKHL